MALSALVCPFSSSARDLRIGIIGCDTSHVIAFTETLNNASAQDHVPGGKVVAAFKGGSPDLPSSADRVEGYSRTLKEKYSVRFYDTIGEMCRNVDAVLLESVDGRPHLEQARAVFGLRRSIPSVRGAEALVSGFDPRGPTALFIDKPMAGSLQDVKEIFRLARRARMPVFSASSLRYSRDTQAVRRGSIGTVAYAETYGPCEIEPHHPDLFWYGVHGVEALFTVMGTGCATVQRGQTTEGKIEVTGIWRGGRKGILREDKQFHGMAKGERGDAPVGSFDGYGPLLVEIMKFFKTGVAPVPAEETEEMFEFMEAADASKAKGGAIVELGRTGVDPRARAGALPKR
jgi:predicted dehydrogenase